MFSKGEGGRPKGAENKASAVMKEIYSGILERNQDRIEQALNAVYQRQPAKFLDVMIKLSEFVIPKMRAVDTKIDMEEGVIEKITVEVRKKSDGANN